MLTGIYRSLVTSLSLIQELHALQRSSICLYDIPPVLLLRRPRPVARSRGSCRFVPPSLISQTQGKAFVARTCAGSGCASSKSVWIKSICQFPARHTTYSAATAGFTLVSPSISTGFAALLSVRPNLVRASEAQCACPFTTGFAIGSLPCYSGSRRLPASLSSKWGSQPCETNTSAPSRTCTRTWD